MKKVSLITIALLMTVSVFAQKSWVGGSISYGSSNINNQLNYKSWSISPEFGYMITENISADVSLGYLYLVNIKSSIYAAQISGNYWIPLSNDISYTPGIFLSYMTTSSSTTSIFGAGISLLKFNCRISNKISLGVETGNFTYMFNEHSNEATFNFNAGGGISFRYWL